MPIRLQKRGPSALQRTLEKLPSVLDGKANVIEALSYYTPAPDEPDLVHCHAVLTGRMNVPGQQQGLVLTASGTGLTRDAALAKAIGESVERHCSGSYRPQDVKVARYEQVKAQAVDPRRFVLFSPDQYRSPGFLLQPLPPDSHLGWVEGFSLTRNETTLVPAAIVYASYHAQAPDDPFELPAVSGYAAALTMEEAILGGITEVIERDSFMVFWYNRLRVPAIDLRSLKSPDATETLQRYRPAPVRLHCANLTTDTGIPAVLAMMTSKQPGWPAAVVALAANVDPERAVTRAFQELAANLLLVRSLLSDPARRVPAHPGEVLDQEDHALFYCSPERLAHLDPILRPSRMVPIDDLARLPSDDLKETIEQCVRRLNDLNLEVIVVDITTPEVRALGFHVVKVVIPGAQPIDFGRVWLHLGGRRLYEAPVRMGYRERAPHQRELNLVPHPFP